MYCDVVANGSGVDGGSNIISQRAATSWPCTWHWSCSGTVNHNLPSFPCIPICTCTCVASIRCQPAAVVLQSSSGTCGSGNSAAFIQVHRLYSTKKESRCMQENITRICTHAMLGPQSTKLQVSLHFWSRWVLGNPSNQLKLSCFQSRGRWRCCCC
jgi:hypothetical protein